ncbi:DnaJ domain-containing protein [Nannizzia gypsea CBS 118893]|uniref:DnaJ domain-containing protein n=1 Tax=Arthroderma gypseum (strain ATCC MYA-4604 / CBS 118893) TaxID=535722 RepID=E4UXY1_ARTGP|nr:DnaJ domain-containing protein [Nannizzia gypsea CBS 118893]EFR02813.1 DnaJ domain-containing protein [Nannizzia gypsea CBS 118893]
MIVRFQTVAFLLAVISSTNGLQSSDIPPDTPVSSLLSSAKTHLASGSAENALLYFNAAIDKDPSNYLSIFQRGAAYLSLGRHSRAADDFNRVLKLKPGFEGALLQRGKLRMRSGNWAGAKEDLEAAGKPGEGDLVQLHEAQVAALAAEDAEKKQDWEACVAQSNIAIMKAMGSTELRRIRGKCHLERGDIQEGINDLTRLTQLSPNNVDPYLQISAMLFYSLADTERGMDHIRKCLHSDPDSKICSRLFRGEKRNSKQIKNLNTFLETRKFHKAAELLVGTKGETGLLEDIQQDVKSAQEDGYIHPKAPNALYHSLVEKTCETYRTV